MMFPKTKLLVLFLSALFVGYGLLGGLLGKVAPGGGVYRDLSIFTDVLHKVREEYVEKPDMEKAMLGALHGMMEALDPYSSFVDAETYGRLQESRRGLSASPGLVLSKRYGYAYVVSVLGGSPAQEEGLRTGDLLESIEGRSTTRMSLWEARQLLLGPEKSVVDVRVIRSRRMKPSEIKLRRETVKLPQVSARVVEGGVAVLRIPHLQRGAAPEVAAKLKMLRSLGIRGLMVDLRGCALGEVEEAAAVGDLFLPKGRKIVSVADRSGQRQEFVSLQEPLVSGLVMVSLVDGGTSGAAEVLAAALEDNGVARLVGQKTNGEGSIQEEFSLEDGSVLRISTRLFYRANGELIQARKLRESGLTPEVAAPSQDFVTNFYFEHAPEEEDAARGPGEDFYRHLDEAIRREQFEQGLREIRTKLLKEAA